MADDKYAPPDDKRPGDPTEGVRIIGAEEAAEAMERGDVASRRGGDQPRYGDRPEPPPVGPRPALRFPLDATSDPTRIEKPPVRSDIAFEPLSGLGGGGGQRFDPIREGDPEPEPAPEPEPEADLFVGGDAADDIHDVDEPAVGDDPVSAPVELPHWSEPPTGEVPRALVGDEDDDDLDAWSSFAASSPRWRDSGDREWESGEAVHEVLAGDDDWRVGAMDDERPTHDELYSFEDLEQEAVPAAAAHDDEYDPDWQDAAVFDDELADEDLDAYEDEPVAVGRARRRTPPPRRNPVADYASGASGYAPPDAGMGRNVGTAMGVGLAFAAVALFLFSLGPQWAMALVVPVLTLAAVELFNAVRRAGYQPAVLLGLVASASFPLAVYWKGMAAYPVLLVLTVLAAFVWHLVGADGDARVVESIGVTLFGVFWIGGLGSFAALMLAPSTGPDGVGFLLAALIATIGYDVGGFFVGRSAGTRPLSSVSPNKTMEGLFGGVGVSVLATVVIVGIIGIAPFDSVGAALVVGLAAAVAAPLGDLAESMVKRDLGIKDMGSILPEHGGFLDRFDGLLFVLPVVFFAAQLFSVGPFS